MTNDSPPSSHDSGREERRQYTLSISEEDRQKSFSVEDERWERRYQVRDWLILVAMVLITLIWQFLVYFLEPGLR